MANRQALRELQSRLATRLQAARSEGPAVAWLAAEAGGALYLFPLGQAGEIFPWSPVQPVPFTAPWFMGMANLRGSLAGVVDLVGFEQAEVGRPAPRRGDALLAESSLLTFNALLGVQCALVIDRLAGLRGGEDFMAVEPPPGHAPPWFGSLYTDSTGGRWQEVDLQALAAHPPFLGITA